MATAAQLRKIALALPDVEEHAHMDHPDFRRSGKIFAGLVRGERVATLRLSPEIQSTLVGGASPFVPCAGAWGRKGWTQVELAVVDVGLLTELLREAWELTPAKAPKKKAAPKKRRAEAPTKKAARARR